MKNLAKEANNRVEVNGTAYRSAPPTPPASQVVQVDSLETDWTLGGCLEAITKLKDAGVESDRTGEPGDTAQNYRRNDKSHTGIYVGVGAAGCRSCFGIGVALGSGKKSNSP